MSDTNIVTIDLSRQMRAKKVKIDPARVDEFMEVIQRAHKAKNPAAEDVKSIRKFLTDYPEFCSIVFDGAEATQSRIIKSFTSDAITKTAIEGQLVYMRNEMGYPDAPMIERMLIDNIITAWLRVQYIDYSVAARMGGEFRIAEMEFWQKSLASAQRNYLAACETLAKVRKMKLPNLQLNIGDKQINVAGNLQAGPPHNEEIRDA